MLRHLFGDQVLDTANHFGNPKATSSGLVDEGIEVLRQIDVQRVAKVQNEVDALIARESEIADEIRAISEFCASATC
ncbi:MAG TPA: hypothetical protein ENJ50_04855 [Planctomycetaceae bacterium]|nr:hypothetical protein [Planctomycetaceae bacterium]